MLAGNSKGCSKKFHKYSLDAERNTLTAMTRFIFLDGEFLDYIVTGLIVHRLFVDILCKIEFVSNSLLELYWYWYDLVFVL